LGIYWFYVVTSFGYTLSLPTSFGLECMVESFYAYSSKVGGIFPCAFGESTLVGSVKTSVGWLTALAG
jgi:hypothetical protein